MKPYYAHCSPNNLLAQQSLTLRRLEYEMFQEHLPEPSDDIEIAVARISMFTGMPAKQVTNIIMAHFRLLELPRLKELHESMWHLDTSRLLAIDRALLVASEKALQAADEMLTDFLTPSRENQHMPSAARIRAKIVELLRTLDLVEQPAAEQPRVEFDYFSDTQAFLGACLAPDELRTIEEHVRKIARNESISLPEALVKAIIEDTNTTVVINAYQAYDVPNSPVWIPGMGWKQMDITGNVRNIDEASTSVTPSYTPTEPMRRFVEGRDGTCRWPGCSVPAHRAQKDHRVEWDKGPTTPANLVSLCQHHHNVKTDGRAFYILDPITGDIYWLFEDGTWVFDEATGPLAPKSRNWVQSFAQKMEARKQLVATSAQTLRQKDGSQ